MRLARVIAKLEPGGAQLSALRLTRATEAFGVETRFLAGQASPEGLAIAHELGIDAEVWGGRRPLQYACSRGLAEWLRLRLADAEIVHAHMFGAWWAAAQALAPDVPLLATEHNAYQWPARPRTAEMRRALRRVDLFLAHGPTAQRAALAAGLPLDRVRVGRSPVVRLDSRPMPGLERPRVVFAGRLEREKGPDLLVEALHLMDPPPAAYLVGDGSLTTDLRSRAEHLGLGGAVRLTGWRGDPGRWIAGAAACAVPSRHDAWSQTAVLAMGLRTPVVAAAVEGLPQVCAADRGVLVPPEDAEALACALHALVTGQRRTNLDAAEAYARRFEPQAVAAAYVRDYEALLSRTRECDVSGRLDQPFTAAPADPGAVGQPGRRAA